MTGPAEVSVVDVSVVNVGGELGVAVDGGGASVVEVTVAVTVVTVIGAEDETFDALFDVIAPETTAGVPDAALLQPASSAVTPIKIHARHRIDVCTPSPWCSAVSSRFPL